jgi:ElaB/YqjD/DUF883 family membrane-anchored ribosome-binding protein
MPTQSAVDPAQIADQVATLVRSAAEQAPDLARAGVEQARSATESAVSAAQQVDLAEVRETLTEDIEQALDETRAATRERPIAALLVALGLGFLVGALVARRRNKKRPATVVQPV